LLIIEPDYHDRESTQAHWYPDQKNIV